MKRTFFALPPWLVKWVLVLCTLLASAAHAVQLTVEASTQSVNAGSNVDIQLLASNDGTETLQNLTVNMIYPQNLNALNEQSILGPFNPDTSCNERSGSAITICVANEPLNWQIDSLAPGESVYMELSPTLGSRLAEGEVITFNASISDDTSILASALTNVSVDINPEFGVSLTANKHPVASGDTLDYSIRFGNRSDANITDSSLSLALPEGVSFVSASNGGSFADDTVTWALGSLPVGLVDHVQVRVNVSAASGKQLSATATITGQSSFNPVTRIASMATPVGSSALEMAVVLDSQSVTASDSSLVQFVVTNTSDVAVTDVKVNTLAPHGLGQVIYEEGVIGPLDTSLSCNTTGAATHCTANEMLAFNLGTMAAGASKILSFPVVAAARPINASFLNIAAVLSAGSANNVVAEEDLTLELNPAFSLVLEADKHPVQAGDTLRYTLKYGNRGDANVTASTLNFDLPAGTSYLGSSDGGSFSSNYKNGQVSWNLNTVPVSLVDQVTVDLKVDDSLTKGVQLKASSYLAGTRNFAATERQADLITPVGSSALDLEWVLDNDSVESGTYQQLQILVTNTSSNPVLGAELTMNFPQGLNGTNEAHILGPFDPSTSCNIFGSSSFCDAGERLNWNLATLAPGATRLLSLPATLLQRLTNSDPINFMAVLTSSGGGSALAEENLIVDNAPELTLAIMADKHPANVGESLSYTLLLGNRATSNIQDTKLVFELPAGTRFLGASAGGEFEGGKVSWDLDTLNVGVVDQVQVQLALADNLAAGTQLNAKAKLSGDLSFVATERVASLSTPVANNPLSIAWALDSLSAASNELVNAQLIVRNTSASPATGAKVSMIWPERVDGIDVNEIIGAFDNGTSCTTISSNNNCLRSERLNWNLGTLAPGANKVLSVPLGVSNRTTDAWLVNLMALASADDGAVSQAETSLIVDNSPDLNLSLVASKHSVNIGEVFDYQLRYSAFSTEPITDVSLVFDVPEGLEFVAASGGGTYASDYKSGRVTWALADLDALEVGERIVRLKVSDGLSDKATLHASARIAGTLDFDITSRSVATRNSVVASNLAFSVTALPTPVAERGNLPYVLKVKNTSSQRVSDVTAYARFPRGFTAIAKTTITGPFDADTSCLNNFNRSNCVENGVLNWRIPALNPGEEVEMSFAPTLLNGVPNSAIPDLQAFVSADDNPDLWQSIAVPVGVSDDADSDGLGAKFDNCVNSANVDQANFDLDANGDVCDADDDNDQLPDEYEQRFGFLNQFDNADAALDFDNDSFTNLAEYLGNSDPSDRSSTPAEALTANAGADQLVPATPTGNTISLDGSASTGVTTATWTQTAGPSVTLADASELSTSFTLPNLSSETTFVFELSVSNGSATQTDELRIAVDLAPIADAGADQPSQGVTIYPGDTVTLNGSNSSDDRTDPLSYSWQESSTQGVSLSDDSAAMPTFTAPFISDTGGALSFELSVNDGLNEVVTDQVVINIDAGAPSADAGPDVSGANVGGEVCFNAANSADLGSGSIVSYSWARTSGAEVTLDDATAIAPCFNWPTGATSIEFELTVTDNDGLQARDQVTASGNIPVASCEAGNDVSVSEGLTVLLDGKNSSISAGTISYVWSQTAGPNVTLNTPQAQATTFVAPDVTAQGAALVFELRCRSNLGALSKDQVTITVGDVEPPVANAGDDQNVKVGDQVCLNASASSDPDGDDLSYRWTQTNTSVNTPSVTLSTPDEVEACFTAPNTSDVNGTQLSFEVSVSELSGTLSDTDTVVVTIMRDDQIPSVEAKLSNLSNIRFEAGQEGVVMSFSLTSDVNGAELYELSLSASGDLDELSELEQVRLYHDVNGDGLLQASDVRLAQGAYLQDDGNLLLSLDNAFALVQGDSTFIITYEFTQ